MCTEDDTVGRQHDYRLHTEGFWDESIVLAQNFRALRKLFYQLSDTSVLSINTLTALFVTIVHLSAKSYFHGRGCN
jgi:hypothetical protein